MGTDRKVEDSSLCFVCFDRMETAGHSREEQRLLHCVFVSDFVYGGIASPETDAIVQARSCALEICKNADHCLDPASHERACVCKYRGKTRARVT